MEKSLTIETERLLLVAPEHGHAGELARLGNERAITDNLATMAFPYGREDAIFWIDAVAIMTAGAAFVINLKQTSEVIGCCGSGPVDDKDEIDFGYWLGREFWGNGLATEAGFAVLKHVFDKYRFDIITTDCQIENTASMAVLEKLGFRQVGQRYRYSASTGANMKTVKVELAHKDWRQARQESLRVRL